MALIIVIGISFIVLHRRKVHRREKRRIEKDRLKALHAAGLTSDEIAQTKVKCELGAMDQTYRMKKKRFGSKVTHWRKGLRRRKGPAPEPVLETDIEVEDKSVEDVEEEPAQVVSRRSTDTPPSSVRSLRTEPVPSLANRTLSEADDDEETVLDPPMQTYFPPAYRPASLRPGPSSEPSALQSIEKTRVQGHYPAPTTEEAEVAEAISSRSDGKQRIVDCAPVGTSGRMRHVATDDKRVLEQVRLGASAPTVAEAFEGPSAPSVELDEEGFERDEAGAEAERQSQEHERPVGLEIAIPPPTAPIQRSLRIFEERSPELPSSPPACTLISSPSAPPLLDKPIPEPSAPDFGGAAEEEDDTEDAEHIEDEAVDEDGGEIEGEEGGPPVISVQVDESDLLSRGVGRIMFLPKYEP
ncbi:hypothetical protein P7C73_g5613, partial [Tremellales sp. Uapishka_1]